jgi:hypothetical protein
MSMGCSAEEKKEEWSDKNFNFKALRTVVVQLSISSDVTVSDDAQKGLNDILANELLSANINRVKFISSNQLEDKIGKLFHTDMQQLRVEDNAQYCEMMEENTHLVADGILKITIKSMKTTQVFVPSSTYSYVEYQTTYTSVPIFLPNGGVTYTNRAVQTPVTRTVQVPAHMEDMGFAGVEFTLESCNTQQKAWYLLDMRDSLAKKPLDMTVRIFRRATDKIRALTS